MEAPQRIPSGRPPRAGVGPTSRSGGGGGRRNVGGLRGARGRSARNFSLIPGAIEEVLRYEAPSPVQARYVARDAEYYGRTIPEGSVMLLLNGSANRDERRYPDGERFDIHRGGGHLSFGQGLHFCLGSALARMQARVTLEEVIKRWPDWEVDYDNASKAHTSSVRGWAKLPVFTGR